MSAGFYKKKTDTELRYAPNYVKHKNYTLAKTDKGLTEMKETYGWKWFDTDTEAHEYFQVVEKLWTPEHIALLDKMESQEKIDLLNTKDLTGDKIVIATELSHV